jgi:magnesium-transporting ATPase (P-type)
VILTQRFNPLILTISTGESLPVSKAPLDQVMLGNASDQTQPVLSRTEDKSVSSTGSSPSATPILTAISSPNSSPDPKPSPNSSPDLIESHTGSVLFGGTVIKSCGPGSVGVCYRTGFRSARGRLISSLLNPKEGFLQFFSDLYLVIFLVFLIATVLYIYEAKYLFSIGEDWSEVIILYFNALTVAMPVGLAVSQNRLYY